MSVHNTCVAKQGPRLNRFRTCCWCADDGVLTLQLCKADKVRAQQPLGQPAWPVAAG